MIIYLGTDHAGFELKELVKPYLESLGHTVVDKGAYQLTPGDDYPDFIAPVARVISENAEEARAIIFGRTGQAEAMVANRFPNVRAAVYYGDTLEVVRLSRAHNDANVLSIGAHFVSFDAIQAVLNLWLTTPYEGGRHESRIQKIESLTR